LYWGTRSLDSTSRAVLRQKLTYLSVQKLQRIERAVATTRELPGDVLEFGVALGGSGIILAHGAGKQRRFIGFDVFDMIPPPSSEKDDDKSRARYELIRSGKSRGIHGDEYYGYRNDLFEEVKLAFARNGAPVDGERIMLVKGLFEETWPTINVSAIALAHIDCDWYDPVKFCLDACAGKMCKGGMVVIDDYYDWAGCRTAVDAFLAERKDFMFEDGPNPILRKL
jgi:asparagine synthase (glutamine-hydrolysing)